MNQSTGTDSAEVWHPEWCSQVEDTVHGSEHWHFSHPNLFEREVGRISTRETGESFRVELVWKLDYESGPQHLDEWDVAATVSVQSGSFDENVHLTMGTNRLRDLADFLSKEADRLDEWAEQQGVRQ